MTLERRRKLEEEDSDLPSDSDSDGGVRLQKGGRKPADKRTVTHSKRRQLEDESESEADDESEDERFSASRLSGTSTKATQAKKSDDDDDEDDETKSRQEKSEDDADSDADSDSDSDLDAKSTKRKLPRVKIDSTAPKNLVVSDEAIKKSGVLYVSRIPPFMKPHKLRTLLEPYGKINRTFLMPEDPAAHQRRVRAGGSRKKLYTEGWLEFVDKRAAKRAHELLNTQTIGGPKRSYYRDDVWSLVYLRGFKWRDLMSQIAAENAERTSRMRAELSLAAKENKTFVANVERARVLDGIRAKRQKKEAADVDETTTKPSATSSTVEAGSGRAPMSFQQHRKIVKEAPAPSKQLHNVLDKIF